MSYQEKKTLLSLVTSVLVLVSYCLYAFGEAGAAHMNDLQFWAKTILIFIGIGVVTLIIIQIVFHILLAISRAVKQKMKDEAIDDKEIEVSIEREMVEDEMDKMIELKASRFGYTVIGVGFIAGLVAIAFGATAIALVNILFISMWVGSFLECLAQIRYYRKGIR